MASSSLQDTEWPSVAEFYAHRDILITGATGFMGKCLGEKLLRSVPELGRLLVLVRPKRGKSVKERIDTMLKSRVQFTSVLLIWFLSTYDWNYDSVSMQST